MHWLSPPPSPLVDSAPGSQVPGAFFWALYHQRPMPKHLKPADYLKKILTARVYDVAVESALEPAKNLSRRLHNKVLLKREDQQAVFSFKLRGAYNKMAT
jgi:tryptophan synthase beta subunit